MYTRIRHTDEELAKGARLIAQYNYTIRKAAESIGVSKSTLHQWIRKELPLYDSFLYHDVHDVLEQNLAERHMRGGMSTQRKYATIRAAAHA